MLDALGRSVQSNLFVCARHEGSLLLLRELSNLDCRCLGISWSSPLTLIILMLTNHIDIVVSEGAGIIPNELSFTILPNQLLAENIGLVLSRFRPSVNLNFILVV